MGAADRARWGLRNAAVLALIGCGARPSTPRPPLPSAHASPLPLTPATQVNHAELIPMLAPLPNSSDATSPRAIVSGRRAERRGGEWRFARQVILDDVTAAVELARGWVFATDGGMVVASDDFLGDLRRVGDVPHRFPRGRWSGSTRGRMAFVQTGQLWTTDGVTLDGPVELPSEVASVSFRDERVGVAAMDDGSALLSRDAGAHWEPLLDGHDPVDEASLDGSDLVIRTASGRFVLTADGRLAPRTSAEPTREPRSRYAFPETVDPSELAHAWRREYGGGSCMPGVPLADGTCLSAEGEWWSAQPAVSFVAPRRRGSSLSTFDPSGGDERSVAANGRCTVVPWGRDAAVLCERLLRTADGRTLEAVNIPESDELGWSAPHDRAVRVQLGGRDFRASDDGRHAALSGRCVAQPGGADADHFACAVLDGRARWRDVQLPTGATWDLGPMHDDLLLLHDHAAGSGRFVVVSVETSVAREVVVESAPPELRVGRLRWTTDGALVGVAARGDERLLVRGRPGEPLAASAMPADTISVVFADASRGYAWGWDARVLWRTLDGGARWERLPVPVDGELDDGAMSLHFSWCETDRCVIGPWSVAGWGPVTPTATVAFAPRAVERPPWGPATPEPVLRCTTGPRIARDPTVDVAAIDGGERSFAADEPPSARRIAWRVRGRRLGPLTAPGGTSALAASARGLLVGAYDPPAAWWFTLDGVRRRLEAPGVAAGQWGHVVRGLPLPDGGVVVLVQGSGTGSYSSPEEGTRRTVGAIRLDARGAVVAWRRVWSTGMRYGLARRDARWGLALQPPTGGMSFVPLVGEPVEGDTLPRVDALPPVCAAAEEGDGTVAHLAAWLVTVVPDAEEGYFVPARADVALRGGAWCTRRLAFNSPGASEEPASEELLRAEGGELRGSVERAGVRRSLRCELHVGVRREGSPPPHRRMFWSPYR